MADMTVLHAQQEAQVTHTGDTAWTAKLTLAAAQFTAGKKYLLIPCGGVSGSSNANQFGVRAVHGATAFAQTEMIFEPNSSNVNQGAQTWAHIFEFTQPGGGAEDISIQVQCTSSSLETVGLQAAHIVAIEVDSLPAGAYHYAEDDDLAAVTGLTTSRADFAKITFTPGTTGHDWLVLAAAAWNVNSVTTQAIANIRRDGTTATPTESLPEIAQEGENTAEVIAAAMSRTYNLDNSEHVFAVQMRTSSGTGHEHRFSAICALDLNAFVDHNSSWVEALHTHTSANSDEHWTDGGDSDADVTPTATGNFLVVASASNRSNASAGDHTHMKLQANPDGAGLVAHGGTSWARSHSAAPDYNALFVVDVISFATGAARAVELHGQSDTTTEGPVYRALSVVSVAKVAEAPANTFPAWARRENTLLRR